MNTINLPPDYSPSCLQAPRPSKLHLVVLSSATKSSVSSVSSLLSPRISFQVSEPCAEQKEAASSQLLFSTSKPTVSICFEDRSICSVTFSGLALEQIERWDGGGGGGGYIC